MITITTHTGKPTALAETDPHGTPIRTYIWADDAPLALITADGGINWFYIDHLGTPQLLTGEAGQVVWQATFEPFGKAEVTVSEIDNPLRFPGSTMTKRRACTTTGTATTTRRPAGISRQTRSGWRRGSIRTSTH